MLEAWVALAELEVWAELEVRRVLAEPEAWAALEVLRALAELLELAAWVALAAGSEGSVRTIGIHDQRLVGRVLRARAC